MTAVGAHGAHLEMLDGRARARLNGNAWSLAAGPYRVLPEEPSTSHLEIYWLASRDLLLVNVRSGRASVQGASAGAQGVRLGPGETLLARASDGLARVGPGHLLIDSLARADAEPVAQALTALAQEAAADGAGTTPVATEDRGRSNKGIEPLLLPSENGVCRPHETSPLAEALPDPGTVNLQACRHVDPGPTGKDLRARAISGVWVRPSAGGCLKYAEDTRGNRVPDFSHSGYHSGGVGLPRVAGAGRRAPAVSQRRRRHRRDPGGHRRRLGAAGGQQRLPRARSSWGPAPSPWAAACASWPVGWCCAGRGPRPPSCAGWASRAP